MGRVQARFKGFSEGQGFGFTAERHSVLIQANLPAGCCQFFYQDLHCAAPLVKDVSYKTSRKRLFAEFSIVDLNKIEIVTEVNSLTDGKRSPALGMYPGYFGRTL